MSEPPRTILVNAPWGAIAYPSIQAGLLKACLAERGLPCDVACANLWLLERLSYDDYLEICEEYSFLGEWLFAEPLFGDVRGPDGLDFWDAFARRYPRSVERFGPGASERFRALRKTLASGFLDDALARVDWGKYAVVGFSCTFDQVMASLALSRELKRRHPLVRIVFGGTQMDGPMGLAYQRAFPWIDHVVLGEAEESFPALVESLAAGRGGKDVPGVSRRDEGGRVVVDAPARPVQDIGRFPVPDYSDYFETLDALCAKTGAVVPTPSLLIETAKGCWWGERSHCVFCSLSDETIAFRAKSADRVLSEMSAQSARHRLFSFRAVDSIFERKFFDELLPRLEGRDFDFYFESKANVSEAQMAQMARSGVREFLIGIDSLSSGVLKLMRKGGTMLQNVQLLKWARRHGIRTEWAILYGCPGETRAMYDEMAALIPKLAHLEPPRVLWRLKLLRFSPFFDHPEKFGIRGIRPIDLYSYLFPKDALDLDAAAFIFDARWESDETARAGLPVLKAAVDSWKTSESAGRALTFRRGEGFLELVDARAANGRRDHVLVEGPAAEVYELCDAIRSRSELSRLTGLAEGELARVLRGFVERGVMLEENGLYLSLAQPARPAPGKTRARRRDESSVGGAA